MLMTAVPTDVWDYFSQTVPAGALINGLGLGALAILFATDRILTKGQHLRRIGDLVTAYAKAEEAASTAHTAELEARDRYHSAILVEKDKALAIVTESRDGYKAATKLERERADTATKALGEFSELGRLATHLLRSLDEAKGPSA
jgi:G:T/U-mismatch repair DNA glycosylase